MLSRLLFHGSTTAAIIALLWSYQSLPARVAIHFNLSGKPDMWASKTTYLLTGTATLALMWLIFASLPRLIEKTSPENINIPDSEYWLSPENMEEFHSIFRGYSYFYGGVTQLFLLAIGVVVHYAQAQHARLSTGHTLILLAIFMVITFGWIIALVRRLKR